jgi:hypothetical protein
LDESSFLLVFPARDFPALPAVPALLLNGKEGINGSSPLEGNAFSKLGMGSRVELARVVRDYEIA